MSFDIERYKETSSKLDLSDIDWQAVRRHPLPQGAVDSMLYMMDIETHTVIYLSELLVSKACMDPVITSFLSVWVYEEMYHGEAFSRFLRAYGIPVEPERAREVRLREGLGRVSAVLAIMFGSYLFDFFPAIYLSVGAINEMTTLTAYEQLSARADHPVLTTILSRIIKQERVHYAFYRAQAARLLAESETARRVTNWFLRTRFVPVGEGVKTRAQVDALAIYLFDGPDGRAAVRRIDDAAGRLPGQAGVSLLEPVVDRAERRYGVPTTSTLPRADPRPARMPERDLAPVV
ncbi:MAG: ferritin-like domain-containing protein [Candidatus Dormibacteria bacterium]